MAHFSITPSGLHTHSCAGSSLNTLCWMNCLGTSQGKKFQAKCYWNSSCHLFIGDHNSPVGLHITNGATWVIQLWSLLNVCYDTYFSTAYKGKQNYRRYPLNSISEELSRYIKKKGIYIWEDEFMSADIGKGPHNSLRGIKHLLHVISRLNQLCCAGVANMGFLTVGQALDWCTLIHLILTKNPERQGMTLSFSLEETETWRRWATFPKS